MKLQYFLWKIRFQNLSKKKSQKKTSKHKAILEVIKHKAKHKTHSGNLKPKNHVIYPKPFVYTICTEIGKHAQWVQFGSIFFYKTKLNICHPNGKLIVGIIFVFKIFSNIKKYTFLSFTKHNLKVCTKLSYKFLVLFLTLKHIKRKGILNLDIWKVTIFKLFFSLRRCLEKYLYYL
jgi:hypothetical protein